MKTLSKLLPAAYARGAPLFNGIFRLKTLTTLLFIPALVCSAGMSDETVSEIMVGEFESGSLAGWKEESFHGLTRYEIVSDGSRTSLRADSSASASYLIKKVNVDLLKTPVLNWSWRTDKFLDGIDERTPEGDDYPARIYIVFSRGPFFWRTRALNYVWSSSQPRGTIWPSALTGNSMMIAVRSRADGTGRWYEERRNIPGDYRMTFKEDASHVSAVAIMTDTDQSGQEARAWFGNVYFSAR